MKKIVLGLVMALLAMSAPAAQILWKVDIIGGSFASWEGVMVDKGTSFVQYFEDCTIPNKAATDGIDVIAQTSSGVVLSWMYVGDPSFEDKYGPWLEKDQGGGFEYTLVAQQLVLDDLPEGDSIQFLAGYFDWDNIDDTLDIDLDKFTAFAVSTVAYNDIDWNSTYSPGDIAPSNISPIYQWNSVPEPSTAILALLGTCLLLKRRKPDPTPTGLR